LHKIDEIDALVRYATQLAKIVKANKQGGVAGNAAV
jgi:hypothetical protein